MYCHICHDSDYLIHQPAYINAFRWPIHIIGFRDAKSARLVYDGLPTTSESSATETAFGNFSEPILTSTLNLTLTTGKRSHASHEPSYKIPSLLHTVIKLRGSVFFRHADTVFWFFFLKSCSSNSRALLQAINHIPQLSGTSNIQVLPPDTPPKFLQLSNQKTRLLLRSPAKP